MPWRWRLRPIGPVDELTMSFSVLPDRPLTTDRLTRPVVSVVVPIYNEIESIPHLIEALSHSLRANGMTYEMVCIDDGSLDGSDRLLKQYAQERTDLKVVVLRRNYGQTAAIAAGFSFATGRVILTIDGDLQNDPSDMAQEPPGRFPDPGAALENRQLADWASDWGEAP
jgi:glycosyltransferase involved in cell wall biosynthesis